MITSTRRDFLKLTGATLLAMMLGHAIPAAALASPAIIQNGSRRRPFVALTFDDCYLVKKLQELERILEDYPEVKITLFPVGTALLNNEGKDPGIWKRYYQKGHEFGYHGYDHVNPGVRSTAGVVEDYQRWLGALTNVLGGTPRIRFTRPPFGVVSNSFLELCNQYSLAIALWSTGWGGPYGNAAKPISKTHNGDIVLLHIRTDDINNTRQGLTTHAQSGLHFVTLSKLYLEYILDIIGNGGCHVPLEDNRAQECPD